MVSLKGERRATHAGSWYTANAARLASELDTNLGAVTPLETQDYSPPVANAKAVIAPHAGYSYSGPAAAWSYAAIPTDRIKRVFVLGPSHHAYLRGIAITPFASLGTPVGSLRVDAEVIDELHKTGLFLDAKPSVDEEEHSLEMQYPYLRHIFEDRDVSIVPLIVGHPPAKEADAISAVLAKYWADPETFFVISSDFCHWGKRFSCTPYYPSAPNPPNPVPPVEGEPSPSAPTPHMVQYTRSEAGSSPIWKSIQYMDHEAMDILRTPADLNCLNEWEAYLARTKNTICGRAPITTLLHLVKTVYAGKPSAQQPHFSFVRYEQSSQCLTERDSSVSYVSGVLRLP